MYVCVYVYVFILYKYKQIIQIIIARGCKQTILNPILLNIKILNYYTDAFRNQHGNPENIICYVCEYT